MFTCHIYCYPWDLLDEGIDEVLDRLQDRVGATGLTLVTASDEIEQFRPRPGVEPRIYRTTGGIYFQPNDQNYQATRLKPPVWEQHRKMDVLARISEHSADRRLDLRLSISPFCSRRLVNKHPEVACKNAYGIASRGVMCPVNPDVREYLLSMVRDLAAYDNASAIVLDEVQTPAATDPLPYVQALAMFDSDVTTLLNICFCESCLQAADRSGVDGQAALRCTRSVLDRLSQETTPEDWTMVERVEANPPIAQYLNWADSSLLDLFKRLTEVSSKSVILNFHNAGRSFADMHIAPDLFAVADKIIVDAADMEGIIGELSRGEAPAPASVQQMELLLGMDEGSIDEAPEVVRQLTWAAEAGAAGTTVTHYGALFEHHLDWIHQGLRNARRLTNP